VQPEVAAQDGKQPAEQPQPLTAEAGES
jgi:hypothetical protein